MVTEDQIDDLRVKLASDQRRVRRLKDQARRAVRVQDRDRLEARARYWQDHAVGLTRVITAAEAATKPPEKSLLPTANQLYRSIMAAMRGGPTY
jgi:hypothetical protein